jgi:hypothetical protein
MNATDPKFLHRPPSEEQLTPENRRDWAFAYAMQRAAEGKAATIREIQAAVREHFGRGIGNQEATEVSRQVLHISTQERRAPREPEHR